MNLGCVVTDTWSCLRINKLSQEYYIPSGICTANDTSLLHCGAQGTSVHPRAIRRQELLIKCGDSVAIADCVPFYFGYKHHMHGQRRLGYPRGKGLLPYMGYIGVCGCKEYGFQ